MKKYQWRESGKTIVVDSPLTLPKASGYLWNQQMLIQMNCRGYASAMYMQPEPSKYSKGPNVEATTFLQPEQPFYTEHPGRFFYVKDEATGDVYSLPYEPMRKPLDKFEFSAGLHELAWTFEFSEIQVQLTLSLTEDMCVELWQIELTDLSGKERNLSVYPCFTVGYMSWMNQSADFYSELNALVASSVTPYQKVEDYEKNKHLKDKTFLFSNASPTSWCCSFSDFVGEGGLQNPDLLNQSQLLGRQVNYETPIAAMQFQFLLKPLKNKTFKFVFGPAHDLDEINLIKSKTLGSGFEQLIKDYQTSQAQSSWPEISTPDAELNHVLNTWLPRQVQYLADLNRLSTDPQTRNYLQDALGVMYLQPETTRERILFAIAQQGIDGEMPDGILLHQDAELKYINQVPHADHSVWLLLALLAYLRFTNDKQLLSEMVPFHQSAKIASVAEHAELALESLLDNTDERGLSYIEQGDWCDPMNMVGHKGQGVSAWLTMATAVALESYLEIAEDYCLEPNPVQLREYQNTLEIMRCAIRQHFKVGDWFARGITDDGRTFGIEQDSEGKMFLNPQSWALLASVVKDEEIQTLISKVNQHLLTPHGMQMLEPCYTAMVEDIGRVTQKSPGVAENGSVYNHAAAFYAYALFLQQRPEQGLDVLMRMMALDENGGGYDQLPNFIPNYYRGAYHQFPDYAGRSSHLINTGTCAWVYRCFIEELCGIQGRAERVKIVPKLPSDWPELNANVTIRGVSIELSVVRDTNCKVREMTVNGELCEGDEFVLNRKMKHYKVQVTLPKEPLVLPHLAIIMGVSGSGKTSVAKELASRQSLVFVDADDFHSEQAKTWMASGKPLTDEMRKPWLERLHKHLRSMSAMQQGCVLAYSGLREEQRLQFRDLGFRTQFVDLNVEASVLEQRLQVRNGHFFPASLLQSQFQAKEPFSAKENDVIIADGNLSLAQLIEDIEERLTW